MVFLRTRVSALTDSKLLTIGGCTTIGVGAFLLGRRYLCKPCSSQGSAGISAQVSDLGGKVAKSWNRFVKDSLSVLEVLLMTESGLTEQLLDLETIQPDPNAEIIEASRLRSLEADERLAREIDRRTGEARWREVQQRDHELQRQRHSQQLEGAMKGLKYYTDRCPEVEMEREVALQASIRYQRQIRELEQQRRDDQVRIASLRERNEILEGSLRERGVEDSPLSTQ